MNIVIGELVLTVICLFVVYKIVMLLGGKLGGEKKTDTQAEATPKQAQRDHGRSQQSGPAKRERPRSKEFNERELPRQKARQELEAAIRDYELARAQLDRLRKS